MPRPPLQIEIVRPDRDAQVAPVERTPFAIGSAPGADLRLPDDGVLPRHAQVFFVAGAWHLLPDPAATSLSIDGDRVPPEGAALSQGASMAFGPSSALRLRFVDARMMPGRREERLVTLMEIARSITDSLNLDEVLSRVLEGAVRFSGAQRGYLFLKEGERLVPWSRSATGSDGVEVSLSVVDEVARSGQPIYRDHLQDPSAGSPTHSIVRLRLQAILCLPLAVRQDVIGVVYLDSRRVLSDHRPELPLLEALAGLAAVAIQNSRLVDDRLRAERSLVAGRMASAIVHDLRSPLASIRGLAELLLGRCPEGAGSRAHLETMISEVDRLTALTGDLLQFTRQAPPLVRGETRLAELVCDTLTPFRARMQRDSIRLNLALDEEARARVDRSRMVRALHNLVANALDAMPRDGLLTLRLERRGSTSVLTISDTGGGMSEEARRRIFEPFFSHGKQHGTGLGMAIVRSIVEEHDGAVEVESEPGRGTTVSIGLPSAPAPQEGSTLHWS